MAEILEEFPLTQNRRNSKYPWEEWSDGKIRKAVNGEDYETSTSDFRSMLHAAATRVGMKVKTRKDPDDKFLVFQFYTPEVTEDD